MYDAFVNLEAPPYWNWTPVAIKLRVGRQLY